MKQFLKRICRERYVKKERNQETVLTMALVGDKRTPMTKDEIERVKKLWGGVCIPCTEEWEVFKYLHGFDERFLGHNVYLPLIARTLNNYHYTKFFEDKCLLDCFGSSARFPKVVLRCINGEFYDEHFHQVTLNEIEAHGSVVIKPSVENGNGRGVVKVDTENGEWSKDLIIKYGKNFVVQECVNQHKTTSRFNESSVNTVRITSLYLNGLFSICNIYFRFGKKGSIVDNTNHGGNCVGILENGKLKEYGFNNKLNRIYGTEDIRFKETSFDFMPDLLEKVKEWHINSFSLCKFIGWDVAIDKDGEYILLEINSSQPGIFLEQLASGTPIFLDRTDEVIDYVTHKEFHYGRGLMNF